MYDLYIPCLGVGMPKVHFGKYKLSFIRLKKMLASVTSINCIYILVMLYKLM